MLPSFRLIAATFFCGFLVVFAGLRLAASFNSFHEAFPVMAAHAAPVTITPIADAEMRRGQSAVPVMYDLRFAVSTTSLAPIPASTLPAADRAVPAAAPLDIAPAKIEEVVRQVLPALAKPESSLRPESTVAAIQPAAPFEATPAEPLISAAPAETPKPETAAVAVIDPLPAAPEATVTIDIPLPDPIIVDLSRSATDVAPANSPAAPAEAAPSQAVAVVPANPEPVPEQPAVAIPLPKPKAAATPRAKPNAARRKRTARRTDNSPFGNSFASPFGAAN
jgi:hypothetical protein